MTITFTVSCTTKNFYSSTKNYPYSERFSFLLKSSNILCKVNNADLFYSKFLNIRTHLYHIKNVRGIVGSQVYN
jgi:hypothetical protein